jgi:glycosyltransferase involved in cell wall biosynthesis
MTEERSQIRRPKVLFLITEDWYFWSHRLDLARAVSHAGYDVFVATRVQDHGKRIEDEGFTLLPIRLLRRNRWPLQEVRAIQELIRLYHRIRPDIVHHVAMKPIIYGSWAARLAGVPAVVNAFAGLGHAFIAGGPGTRILRFLLTRALKPALSLPHSRVIFQNEQDAKELEHAGVVQPAQVAIIRGSGVDTAKFIPSPESDGDALVVLASRMLWNKGVGEFIAAVKVLNAQGIRAKYALVGRVDQENPAHVPEKQLRQWQKEGLVEWWGHREDMPQVLAHAHVVVLPTYYGEGMPKILLEAASCGKPVISTNIRGCSEIVRDGKNGLVVPPKDVPALAQAIATLLRDPALRAQMGACGREIVMKEFSVERISRETLDLYGELLGKTHDPQAGSLRRG